MGTKTVYFSGKSSWNRLVEPDTKYNPDGNYSITVYLTPESLAELQTNGLRLRPKEDKDGTSVQFRRPHKKTFGNETKIFGPPTVMDASNNPLTDIIGHGSDVTVKVSVYDTKLGKGHRLEAVRVDKLVPYEPKVPEGNAPPVEAPKKQARPF